jgi:2'-5' RNA ligase
MKRLFAAVKVTPSEDFLETYSSLKAGLRFARIKWVHPENIHITLKFFGETPEDRIPGINSVLNDIAGRHGPFSFSIANTGIFGSSYNPRVIWFGIEEAEALRSLAEDVLDEVVPLGWERDRQNFVPHLTLGRVKEVKDKRLFQDVIDEHKKTFIQEVSVVDFRLYESILQKDGPVYRVVESFVLK